VNGLPIQVRDGVIQRVYAECDRLEWETLSPQKKTAAYNRWVDDPQIGGELQRHMSRAQARVWLKDVPVHEYYRAINGVGGYVRFTARRVADPVLLVQNTLGRDWQLREGSIREKPLRCVARNARTGTERELIWGPLNNLSSLAWAAISVRAHDRQARPIIVIVRSSGQILAPDDERFARSVGDIIGADVSFVVQTARRNMPVRSDG
jgi:hypothetical protein